MADAQLLCSSCRCKSTSNGQQAKAAGGAGRSPRALSTADQKDGGVRLQEPAIAHHVFASATDSPQLDLPCPRLTVRCRSALASRRGQPLPRRSSSVYLSVPTSSFLPRPSPLSPPARARLAPYPSPRGRPRRQSVATPSTLFGLGSCSARASPDRQPRPASSRRGASSNRRPHRLHRPDRRQAQARSSDRARRSLCRSRMARRLTAGLHRRCTASRPNRSSAAFRPLGPCASSARPPRCPSSHSMLSPLSSVRQQQRQRR
jgi:hypothetical protein